MGNIGTGDKIWYVSKVQQLACNMVTTDIIILKRNLTLYILHTMPQFALAESH